MPPFSATLRPRSRLALLIVASLVLSACGSSTDPDRDVEDATTDTAADPDANRDDADASTDAGSDGDDPDTEDADSGDADTGDIRDADASDAADADADIDASTCGPTTCVTTDICAESLCLGDECVIRPSANGSACGDGDDAGVCDDGDCATCADTETSGIDAGCSFALPSCVEGACIACEEEGPGCVVDCAGTLGGIAREDACGTCDTDPTNDCLPPCEGDACPVVACTGDVDCDDRNACTVDTCVEGVCTNEGDALEGTACDDYSVCTAASTCAEGRCVGSDPVACDGPCLTGECHRASGCVVVPVGDTCSYCPEGDGACTGELEPAMGTCDLLGACTPRCAVGVSDPVEDSPCFSSTVDTTYLEVSGVVRCIEVVNEGARCASDGDHCTDDVCNAEGVCEHVLDTDICSACDTVDCTGACFTGDCVEGVCTRVPAGTSCDDGNENTVDDVCDAEGVCAGACEALECGNYFSFGGDACGGVITGAFSNAACDTDDDPCTVDFCTSDGTCGQTLREEGAACDHLCGTGACSAEGVCELTEDRCANTNCYEASCNLETGACEISEDASDTCHFWSNTCDPAYGLCVPDGGNWCGDMFCEIGSNAQPGCFDCPASCLGYASNCALAYDEVSWAGVWRANESAAYGYVGGAAHQGKTFTRMLDDGYRWLHWNVDFCTPGATSGPLCLCAGDDECLSNTFYLEDGLEEVAGWMQANPTEIVTLYIWNHATGEALRQEVAASEAGSRVYEGSRYGGAYESWPFSIGQMANAGQTLVIIGEGFISPRNVFAATTIVGAEEETPGLDGIFRGGPVQYPCANARGELPTDQGLYALVHAVSPTSINAAACYNTYVTNHRTECREFREDIDVVFVDHYNSSSWLNTWATGPQYDYTERCIDDVETCSTDDDCDSGVCGGLFICINCATHDDCAPEEHCDNAFGSCMADLPDGTVCLDDEVCQSGTCEFLCQSCSTSDDCEGDEWCDAFGGCQDPQPNGTGCINGFECRSGTCWLGYCVECDDQSDCTDPAEFCSLDPLPGESACIATKDNGAVCATNLECASGACFLGFCADCNDQDDCPGDDEFCSLNPLPGESACIDRKPIGYACVQNFECASGDCFLGFCVECNEQSDCTDPDQYCTLDPLRGASACADRKGNAGSCAQNFECASDECFAGFCAECNNQDDCPGDDEFCSLNPAPGASTCIAKKDISAPCAQNFECVSGDCFLGFCVACNEQSDCPAANEFCSLNPAPGTSACIATKANGSLCAQGFECQSTQCTLGLCGECVNNDQCPANEHCDAFNNCAPDVGNNEPCLQDGACTTGICSAGFCAECTGDGHCPASEHCDPFGDCIPDVGNNAVCTRDAVCTTGICSAGFCAECTGDGHCAGNEHCSVGGDCIADVGNGTACTRDAVCTSGACYLGFCAGCNDQGDCPGANDFCSLDPVPGASSCIPEKSNGSLCANAFECASDHCTAGICGECASDANCPASQHCDAFFNCVADVGNNAPCTRNAACSTGICSAGFCAECTGDGHCAANEHCDAGGDCAPDVGNNAPCLKDSACTTGICSAGFCAECTGDGHCPSNEHCDAFGDCVADVGNNAACTRNEVCTTGICSAGFCAQCTSDAHCPSSQHCDVWGDCIADVGNNAPCTRNEVCSTGICSVGFCAQCTNDGHCSSWQFCNGGGDCQNKLANGSLCVEHRVCSSGCCGAGFCGGLGC